MNWSEAAFWACSWRGLADAWAGYSRLVLGVDPEAGRGLSRAEAEALEDELRAWQEG